MAVILCITKALAEKSYCCVISQAPSNIVTLRRLAPSELVSALVPVVTRPLRGVHLLGHTSPRDEGTLSTFLLYDGVYKSGHATVKTLCTSGKGCMCQSKIPKFS